MHGVEAGEADEAVAVEVARRPQRRQYVRGLPLELPYRVKVLVTSLTGVGRIYHRVALVVER